jgi:vitamin B12 transporter
LRSSWELDREIKLELKVDNLLDKGYSRALYSHDSNQYGYREEGRALMFGVTWTPAI